jgi:type 1 glutamine amidotransferase
MMTSIGHRDVAVQVTAVIVLMVVCLVDVRGQQPPAAPGASSQGTGRAGGRGNVGAALFTAVDTNKDGAVTRAEMQSAFAGWLSAWDTAKAGALTQAEIAAGLADVLPAPPPAPVGRGGNRGDSRTPSQTDVEEMLKVLPPTAPARPARPRRVLVLADSPGFTHSSIPLAARTIEELGRKTGAWSTTVSYDPNVITAEHLKSYDAIVLDSTVGAFLDEAGDQAISESRRAAFLAFVRSGKGLVGIHAATDAYHSGAGNTPFTRPAATPAPSSGAPAAGRGPAGGGPSLQLAAAIVAQGDKDADQQVSALELHALIDTWFDVIDSSKTNRINAPEFAERIASIVPVGVARRGGGRGGGRAAETVGRGGAPSGGTWPEFNQMIGGIFKNHPWQRVPVKIDDPASPLTSMFKNRSFEFQDETYSFYMDSWSRQNLHVLMSIDYAKMSDADKALESNASARTDGDYGLSWIRRDGRGRVFYFAFGHREDGIYRSLEMLQHLLAGVQYALGDLRADDSPSRK